MDGGDGPDAVIASGDQVSVDPTVSSEGCMGAPVPGHRLVPLRSFQRTFTRVVRPGHVKAGAEKPDLIGLVVKTLGQVVARVVALRPGLVPVDLIPSATLLSYRFRRLASSSASRWRSPPATVASR